MPRLARAGRQDCAAWTLIELLVVIVIVLVLAALGTAGYRSMMDSAAQSRCLSNLRQLTMAYLDNSRENNGTFLASFSGSAAWFGPLRSYMQANMQGGQLSTLNNLFNCRGNRRATIWFREGGAPGLNYALVRGPFGPNTVVPGSGSFEFRASRVTRPSLLAMFGDNCRIPLDGNTYDMSPANIISAQQQARNNPNLVDDLFPHQGKMNVSFFDGSVRSVPWRELQPDWWSRLPQQNPNWQPLPPIP